MEAPIPHVHETSILASLSGAAEFNGDLVGENARFRQHHHHWKLNMSMTACFFVGGNGGSK